MLTVQAVKTSGMDFVSFRQACVTVRAQEATLLGGRCPLALGTGRSLVADDHLQHRPPVSARADAAQHRLTAHGSRVRATRRSGELLAPASDLQYGVARFVNDAP